MHGTLPNELIPTKPDGTSRRPHTVLADDPAHASTPAADPRAHPGRDAAGGRA